MISVDKDVGLEDLVETRLCAYNLFIILLLFIFIPRAFLLD
jgi:hypothetical protein